MPRQPSRGRKTAPTRNKPKAAKTAQRIRMKIQLTLDPTVLQQIDAARGSAIPRSRWIEMAALRALEP